MARHCAHCGAALAERGQFCHRCGTPRDGRPVATTTGGTATGAVATMLPWAVAGISLLSLVAFIVGQNFGRAKTAPPAGAGTSIAAPAPGRAPDISSMSPQERADRLFQRVMTYVGQGQSDSVTFFAPMAIQSFAALAPLDAHQRYDLGLLGLVSGDGVLARAQADTILAGNATHLLGLILGMRAAGLRSDAAARAEYVQRLSTALASERAKGLQEYQDHAADIDAAVREADGRAPTPGQRP